MHSAQESGIYRRDVAILAEGGLNASGLSFVEGAAEGHGRRFCITDSPGPRSRYTVQAAKVLSGGPPRAYNTLPRSLIATAGP